MRQNLGGAVHLFQTTETDMILDRLENAARYLPLQRGFAEAFAFLKRPDLAQLAPGRHEIVGTQVYATVAKVDSRAREATRLEGHRKYIDIQLVVSGVEEMGWRPHRADGPVQTPYDPAKDIEFYPGVPDAWITVNPGQFAIFFPEDDHAPLAGNGAIHKVIVKVVL
jgi:YhcH/YjgK/YiaL family protein